ncbi:hypothetical protein MHLP_02640 [Candidatus Mycoplasma haematolamae str. Purdue]|uniref:Uncharacterized protein n=1 Tax=Mycoplasma haematolamae (strain Purdue) TaxID=1212765 RepID=I7BJR5_MYCHA|nr:hypothetical protein [Candidatus Mycoplasma haematolamae]AFO52108.1 hypothetical protein MHLP_02640 [Candidatus Mycoplasma haematolamae str. Purdue]
MVGVGSAKLLGGALVIAGVSGGAYAVLSPFLSANSLEAQSTSSSRTFRILESSGVPAFLINCPAEVDSIAYLELALSYEDFVFRCETKTAQGSDVVASTLVKEGAYGNATKDKLTCTFQAPDQYTCTHLDQNGGQDSKLVVKKTEHKSEQGKVEVHLKVVSSKK